MGGMWAWSLGRVGPEDWRALSVRGRHLLSLVPLRKGQVTFPLIDANSVTRLCFQANWRGEVGRSRSVWTWEAGRVELGSEVDSARSLLSHGVRKCWSNGNILPSPGHFTRPRVPKDASSGCSQLSPLNTCSAPPVAPFNIWGSLAPLQTAEPSSPGSWLRNPISMLPSWYLSTAKFRNHCPHSLWKCC